MAVADGHQRFPHAVERPEPDQDHQRVEHKRTGAEQREREEQAAVELRDILLDHRIVADHPEADAAIDRIRRVVLSEVAPLVAGILLHADLGFGDAHVVAHRIARRVIALEAGIERDLGIRRRRDLDSRHVVGGPLVGLVVAERNDLPVPAAAGLLEDEVVHRRLALQRLVLRIDRDRIDDGIELGAEKIAQVALGAAGIEARNDEADDDEADHRPERGIEKNADGQRAQALPEGRPEAPQAVGQARDAGPEGREPRRRVHQFPALASSPAGGCMR